MILSIEEKYEKTLKKNEILKMQVEYLKKASRLDLKIKGINGAEIK